MAKISVIIPVYNVEMYLKECLDSLINQTLTDIEIICIDDGSTDNSLQVLKDYAAKDSRFVIETQPNQGQGIARNKAIDIATGEYISFVDPDDWVEEDFFEKVYKKFKETNAQVVQFDYKIYKEINKRFIKKSFLESSKKYLRKNLKKESFYTWQELHWKSLDAIPLYVWDKVYSAKFIKDNNINFAPNKHAEDQIFTLSCLFKASKIGYINECFYNYRIRNNSSVNSVSNDYFCIFDNVKLVENLLKEQNLYDLLKNQYKYYLLNTLSGHYAGIPKDRQEDYLRECAHIFSEKEYKKFLQQRYGRYSFWENIFSIKNKKEAGIIYKVIVVLGFKFKFIFEKRKRYDK